MSVHKLREAKEPKEHVLLDGRLRLFKGEIEYWLPKLDRMSFDACLTDPPYEGAFMGHAWDKTGIAFSVDTWKQVFRLLKPGAPVLAYGGRFSHRMLVACEDAGLELLDTLLWLHGQGMPKGQAAGKSVKEWDGYNTTLKPAYETCAVMRRPFAGTFAQNLLLYNTGGLNINACRIGTDKIVVKGGGANHYAGIKSPAPYEAVNLERNGRYPSNIILSHHPLCRVGACITHCPVRILDKQSGVLKSGLMKPGQLRKKSKGGGGYGGNFPDTCTLTGTYGDKGGASRFFYLAKVAREERDAGCVGELKECDNFGDDEWGRNNRKVTKARNNHPCLKPLDLNRYFATLILPPLQKAKRKILIPFSGAGSEIIGALLAGWDIVYAIEQKSSYVETTRQRIAHWIK